MFYQNFNELTLEDFVQAGGDEQIPSENKTKHFGFSADNG